MVGHTKKFAYIASPYGFAESTKYFYYEELIPLVKKYMPIIDPWGTNIDHILSLPVEKRSDLWIDLGVEFFNIIASNVKLVVAALDQLPPDTGTVAELVWAAARNIPVIGYRSDIRSAGENNLEYNLMISAAIRISGGVEVSSLKELENELRIIVPKL